MEGTGEGTGEGEVRGEGRGESTGAGDGVETGSGRRPMSGTRTASMTWRHVAGCFHCS